MVRTLCTLFFILSFQVSFGKSVDENTAKNIAYNFCKNEGLAVTSSGLVSAYTATSAVNNVQVNDFYVFNNGANGFIMIAADDNVSPVLAYSTESSFRADYIPAGISEWLSNYQQQITYVIKNNIPAKPSTLTQWNDLATYNAHAGSRTTAGTYTPGTPLCTTLWNQSPYYNALCPFDYGADTNVLTGCVATAMAQVMKYWSWPRRGVGNHSYSSSYGMLSADFGTTTYMWDSMPNYISHVDTPIALLMYQAGVSVNMSYGVTESGAFVNTNTSPITNCAQYALTTYFSYKTSTIQGIYRSGYSDSDWVHMLKAEADAGRPSLYTGFGSQGGHCWVADGYGYYDRIHFNWGWGGYCNGYYIVESLVPGGTDLNNGQTLMTGIEPDSSVVAGVKEIAQDKNLNVYPNPAKDYVTIGLGGIHATEVTITDMSGRELIKRTVANNATAITIQSGTLTDGIYLIAIHTVQETITKKLVIAK